MLAQNRFLRLLDLKDPDMERAKRQIEELYVKKFRGPPHPWGAKKPSSIITHWSREWEYAWAIVHANINKYNTILDCGCGGSPLMPFFANTIGCQAHGIDITYGNYFDKDPSSLISSTKPLANLKHFFIDPTTIVDNLHIDKQSLDNIKYKENYFDKIFCISVIEHLEEFVARQGLKEMARVLKPGGKLFITLDHTSYKNHVKSWCEGNFMKIIEWSGLDVDGSADFTIPSLDEVHGHYLVVGFVLRKVLKEDS